MLDQERGGDHAHAVVHPARVPQLPHAGIDDRIAGAAALPGSHAPAICARETHRSAAGSCGWRDRGCGTAGDWRTRARPAPTGTSAHRPAAPCRRLAARATRCQTSRMPISPKCRCGDRREVPARSGPIALVRVAVETAADELRQAIARALLRPASTSRAARPPNRVGSAVVRERRAPPPQAKQTATARTPSTCVAWAAAAPDRRARAARARRA